MNQLAQIQEIYSIISRELPKFSEFLSMCNPNCPNSPDWINDYQPIDDPVDQDLLKLFKELYAQSDGSKSQLRVIQKIWNLLVTNNLVNRPQHQDIYAVYAMTYIWLATPLIILTPDLLTLLDIYCQSNNNGITASLSTHLVNQNDRYIRHWIQKLIALLKISSAESDIRFLAQLNEHICRVPRIWFCHPNPSLKSGLLAWVNEYIYWRSRDLSIDDFEMPESLDAPEYDDDISGTSIIDNIPDGFNRLYNAPTLTELTQGSLFNNLAANDSQQVLFKIKDYLEQDPYQLLSGKYINNTQCTYQILVDRLILKEPADTIVSIAQDFNINPQALYAQINHNFKPTISGIYMQFGYNHTALKAAIEEDRDGRLRNCNRIIQGQVIYDAQFLAKRLLCLFQVPQTIFSTVVNYLNKKGDELRVSCEIPVYHENFLAIYPKIAEELRRQGYEYATSYNVLEYWETATLETIAQELNQQGYRSITSVQIKKFWETKSRKCLGKLLIELN